MSIFSTIGNWFQGVTNASKPPVQPADPQALGGLAYGKPVPNPTNIYGSNTNYGGLSQTHNVAPGTYSSPNGNNVALTNQGITNTQTNNPIPSAYQPSTQQPVQPTNQGTQTSGGQVNTATSQTQLANIPPTGGQTYKLGNGNEYDQTGNLINTPGQNVDTTQGPQTFGGSSINSNTNSSGLSTTTTNGDINSTLTQNQNNESSLFGNLNNLFTTQQTAASNINAPGVGQVSSQEQQQQQNVVQAGANVTQDQAQAAGIINPGNQPIAMPFLTGQARNKLFSDQMQQQIAQASLAYTQGNRQIAYNTATKLFDAAHQNLSDAITMYQASAPKNIQTNYNQLTGEVNTTMINPLTGETYVVNNGNIGASQPLQNVSTTTNPLNGQLTVTGTNATGQPVSYSLDSNGQVTGQISGGSTSGNSLVSNNINPNAVVGGYDLTSYAGGSSATGNYGPSVNSIYQNMPSISNAQNAQNYINSKAGNSPITGDMITNAATAYGVDPKVLMSVMQEESSFGTKGMATSTFNPGNVGNNSDTGKKTNYGSWQAGVNAVAQNLSERQINPPQGGNQGTQMTGQGSPQEIIQQVVSSLPPTVSQAVNYLADGTPYIDGSLIAPGLQTAAQVQGEAKGIKYMDAPTASVLQGITTVQKNLDSFKSIADAALSQYGYGGQYLNFAGLLGSKIAGGTSLNDFNSFRTSAINTLQGLAGGAGSGLRITQAEINTAVDNIPSPTDTQAQADEKILKLNSQLNNKISTLYPGWQIPQ